MRQGITMKLENVGRKEQTVMIYGLAKFEDKKQLKDLFEGYLTKDRRQGEKLEAWKLYDTPNSYRLQKVLCDGKMLQFQTC